MRRVLAFLVVVALLAAAAFGFIYRGVYDVAATRPHSAAVHRLLKTLRERSIAARTDRVPEPPPLSDELLAEGFEHYDAMCVVCHGAPGIDPTEIGQGMEPAPPRLAEHAEDLSEREIYWIVENGIKSAGMPAFGPTHSEDELWGMVGVVRRLGRMTPEEYRSSIPHDTPADSTGGGEHHHHDDNEHEHRAGA